MRRHLVTAAILAISLALSACAQAPDDAWRTEFDRGQIAYDDSRFVDAYEIWLPLAEAGICKAEFAIAQLFNTELTIEQREKITARPELDRLQIGLPHYYDLTGLTRRDAYRRAEFAATYWYQRAALDGHPYAPYRVAERLNERFFPHHGAAWPQSAKLLERFWLHVGAERGDDLAIGFLARSSWDEPEVAMRWALILERQYGYEEAIGRIYGDGAPLITPERFEEIKARANKWIPRSPVDTAPDNCL